MVRQKIPLKKNLRSAPVAFSSLILTMMDFDELDELDPVEVPDESAREIAIVILGATGFGWKSRVREMPGHMHVTASSISSSWIPNLRMEFLVRSDNHGSFKSSIHGMSWRHVPPFHAFPQRLHRQFDG